MNKNTVTLEGLGSSASVWMKTAKHTNENWKGLDPTEFDQVFMIPINNEKPLMDLVTPPPVQ